MKIQIFLTTVALLVSASFAFAPSPVSRPVATTQLYMFGGAGAGSAMEDNPQAQAQIDQAAKAMGMSRDEYMLGIRARNRLTEELDAARVSGGNDKVTVNRDGNNPPKFMEIIVSESGKAAGKEALSKEICAALKSASDKSRTTRQQAQKSMMAFISEEMKKTGA